MNSSLESYAPMIKICIFCQKEVDNISVSAVCFITKKLLLILCVFAIVTIDRLTTSYHVFFVIFFPFCSWIISSYLKVPSTIIECQGMSLVFIYSSSIA